MTTSASPCLPHLDLLESRLLLSAWFVDVSGPAGLDDIIDFKYGHAAAWGDINNNGLPDLFWGAWNDQGPNRLMINNGDGTFTESVQASINDPRARTSGSVFADLNNNGWLDLVVMNNWASSNPVTNQLLMNTGNGNFVDVTAGSGLGIPGHPGRNVWVLDYDNDGLLDLIIQSCYFQGGLNAKETLLMRNNGDMTFTNVTAAAGLPTGNMTMVGLGGAVGDINGDGWADFLHVGLGSNSSPDIRLFINNRDGTFHQSTTFNFNATIPPKYNSDDWICGATFGDLNGNGRMDIVIGQHRKSLRDDPTKGESVRAYMNLGNNASGDPLWQDITVESGLHKLNMRQPHVDIQDFNNDGMMDIWNGVTIEHIDSGQQMPYIQFNQGNNANGVPQFAPMPGLSDPSTPWTWSEDKKGLVNPRYYAASPTADFNRDGKMNIFGVDWSTSVNDPGRNDTALFHNLIAGPDFIAIKIDQGEAAANRYGIGARVTIYEAGQAGDPAARLGSHLIEIGNGYASGREAIAHFGVPGRDFVDVVVQMPNGGTTYTAAGVATRQYVTIPGDAPVDQPPVAMLIAAPTSGDAPLTVNFDASGSFDPDGTSLTFHWDFGDGNTASGAVVTHLYQQSGTFTATVTVTNEAGLSDSASVEIDVVRADNVAPTAVIEASTLTVEVGGTVNFDGSQSSDPDGTIVEWIWDFGHGPVAGSQQESFAFLQAGAHVVSLTVVDNDGATDTATVEILVVEPPNIPPTAHFVASPSSGFAPLEVSFDASASSDVDGAIVAWDWDFGDGSQGAGQQVTYEYIAPGVYVVTLTVTDDRGDSDSTTREVTVAEPPVPPAVDSATVNNGSAMRSELAVIDVSFTQPVALSANAVLLWDHQDYLYVDLSAAIITATGGSSYRLDLSAVSLADGWYTLRLVGSEISNANGTVEADFDLLTHRLAGDANGDAKVNVDDLGILATNYRASGDWWMLGADFTLDGVVNVDDLGILATNYRSELPSSDTLLPPGQQPPPDPGDVITASEDWSDTSGNTRDWPTGLEWGATEETQWRVDWPQQWNVYWFGATSGHREVPKLTMATDGERTIGSIGGHQNIVAYLDAFTVVDSSHTLDVRAGINANVTATNDAGIVGRFDPDARNWYQAIVQRDGALVIQRVIGGSTSSIASIAGVAPIAGQPWYTLSFEIEQVTEDTTALRAKVWLAGTAEPAEWMLDTTDSHAALQNAAGHVGLRGRTSGNRGWQFDSYEMVSVVPQTAQAAGAAASEPQPGLAAIDADDGAAVESFTLAAATVLEGTDGDESADVATVIAEDAEEEPVDVLAMLGPIA